VSGGVPLSPRRAPPTAPAPFWRTARRALAEVYDYLGTVLVTSALLGLVGMVVGWLLAAGLLAIWPAGGSERATGPTGWFPVLLALMLAATAIGPLLAGTARLMHLIAAREDPALVDLFREARLHARSGALLAAIQTSVTLLLIVDLLFFAAATAGALRWLAVPVFYLLLFWGFALPYQWPLYAGGAGRPLAVVRKSALLVLDNLPFTLGVGLLTLLFTLLCVASTVGLLLLWPGALAIFHTIATRALLRRYGLLPAEPESCPEGEPWRLSGGA
jgi:hypothetical protein